MDKRHILTEGCGQILRPDGVDMKLRLILSESDRNKISLNGMFGIVLFWRCDKETRIDFYKHVQRKAPWSSGKSASYW